MSHTGGRRQPYAMRALHGFERRHHAAGVVTGVVVVVALLAAAPSPASASAADGSACSNPGDCASNFCASNVCTALPAITYEGGYEVRRQQSHAGAGLFTLPAGVADFYGKSAGDLAAWNPFPDDGGDWSRIDDTLAVPNERFVKCRQICDMFAGCNYAEVAYGKQCNLYASISGYQGSTLSTFMVSTRFHGGHRVHPPQVLGRRFCFATPRCHQALVESRVPEFAPTSHSCVHCSAVPLCVLFWSMRVHHQRFVARIVAGQASC